ncbi:ABC transporter substrate-binding protein [Kitasatospora sp. NPDC004240]
MRRGWVAVAAATMVVITACSSNGGGSSSSAATEAADPSKVSGSITVLTNRTDQVNEGELQKYAAEFNKIYPNVKVEFEGITDYEGEVKIRMNTENYGDVLLIPNALPLGQYANFFAPLGEPADLTKKYEWTDYATLDGKVYGIPNIGIATGIVYNKAVWAKAGVTEWPTTPEKFIEDLKAIKSKTDATPYYTNYKDGWPLRQWNDLVGTPSCDVNTNDSLAGTAQPWASGKDHNTIDGLLYSIVREKLSETDPTTTNWENSKTLLGTGKVSAMTLGSWAVPQMRKAAKAAGQNPDDIGFMPFPTQVNGKFCTVVRPDYRFGVSKHSKNKEAARAWIEWFIGKSGSATSEQLISAVKGSPLPDTFKPFQEKGVQMIGQNQTKTAVVDKIDKVSEVGLTNPDYRRRLVDTARGAASGDQAGVFADLNKKWSEAQKNIG